MFSGWVSIAPQSLFVGENETDESHHSMVLDVD